MANIKIEIAENGTKTLATAGKYCDRNIDIDVSVAGGGGGEGISEEVLNLTGNCKYRFYLNGWNKFIELYGNQVKTNNITNIASMFQDSNELVEIPFEINMIAGNIVAGQDAFNACKMLEAAPRINNWKVYSASNLFKDCQYMRSFPEGFGDNWDYSNINTTTTSLGNIFANCYSLRKIPAVLLNNFWNKGTSSSTVYYYFTMGCYCLDEIKELSVSPATLTSNAFTATFSSCFRLADMTFAVNEDGSPKTANWKSQTINLSNVGFGLSSYYLYNSGITADKEVKDDALYQALKDDPDWFTRSADYARYNHDSAVNTINSLPDCSAYGTNTIKFTGTAGALTDGGAINTLTEAEIAVAAAKGWTVSFV